MHRFLQHPPHYLIEACPMTAILNYNPAIGCAPGRHRICIAMLIRASSSDESRSSYRRSRHSPKSP
jgi:hypothetical protein